jgi:hypothetical protein
MNFLWSVYLISYFSLLLRRVNTPKLVSKWFDILAFDTPSACGGVIHFSFAVNILFLRMGNNAFVYA